MARRTDNTEQQRQREDEARAAAIAARAEVVDILATAVFTILLEDRAPALKPTPAKQQGECS